MKLKKNCLLAALAFCVSASAPAQVFTVQHTFTNTPDGSNPGQVAAMNGLLYASTIYGGTNGNGSISSFNPNTSAFANLYSFTGGNDGGSPNNLLATNNTIYGTTFLGGSNNFGTVFSVGANGAGFKSLYSFGAAPADGITPQGGLILLGSTLYGTASAGGIYSGTNNGGMLFKINTNGTGYTVLHWFTNSPDGYSPQGELVSDGTVIYGITSGGGIKNGGIVYAINTNGGGYAILRSFTNSSDGYNPYGGLALNADTLYGTTIRGGTNNTGTIFAVNTNGTGYQQIYRFGSFTTNGVYPKARLLFDGGRLCGTTRSSGAGGGGTLFSVGTDGTGFAVLHSFTNSDGANPNDGVIRLGNSLWGTTPAGGNGNGVLYSQSLPLPVITQQPQDFTVTNGFTATFTNVASGSGQLFYQWYFNTNTAVAGGTNDILTISNAATNNAGFYTVVVTNFAGAVTSSPARLTVVSTKPVIIDQPDNLIVTNGNTASFTVVAAGQSLLRYQWYSNSVSTAIGTALAGKTNSTFSFTSVASANGRFYSVVVTNTLGKATSSPAMLTVVTKPLIVTNPQPQTVLVGSPATFSVSALGVNLRYQWYSNSVSTAIGTRVTGQTNDTYTFTAITNANNRYYSVVVTNTSGAATSSPALLTISSLPYITLQPMNVTITNGASVTFTSAAAGPGVLTYQWLFQTNALIAGATNTILAITNANQPGAYLMKVANNFGAATSSPAQLTVVSKPACLSATFDPASGSYSFSYVGLAGSTNRLWASSNLSLSAAWHPIWTNVMATNGFWFFTDSNSAKTNAVRFYRFYTVKFQP